MDHDVLVFFSFIDRTAATAVVSKPNLYRLYFFTCWSSAIDFELVIFHQPLHLQTKNSEGQYGAVNREGLVRGRRHAAAKEADG